MYDKIVAYDLETTGFVAGKADILELGCVIYTPANGAKVHYSSIVHIGKPIDWRITLVTGINESTLIKEGAKPLQQVLREFMGLVWGGGSTPLFVAHNGLGFDNKFINHSLIKYGLPIITEYDTWDTMLQTRADKLRKRMGTFRATQQAAKKLKAKETNLKAACLYYGVKQHQPAHRAQADAANALEIFFKQHKRNKWKILD